MVTCWERADLLAAFVCVAFSCAFVTFPYGVLGQVRYLIVSISDLRLLPYLNLLYSCKQVYTCIVQKISSCLYVLVRTPQTRLNVNKKDNIC